jgi:hypothetical protein
MPHVFVSYSRKDKKFADDLSCAVEEAGYQIWIDRQCMPAARDIDHEIKQAIRDCFACIAILSPNALKSYWTKGEWEYALEQRKPLVPVLYRECDLPIYLRCLEACDFTSYPPLPVEPLRRLLAGLQAASRPGPTVTPPPGQQIGRVHRFDPRRRRIEAVLTGPLSVGDTIHVIGPSTNVTQLVRSLYASDGQAIEKLPSGSALIPFDFSACPGDLIYTASRSSGAPGANPTGKRDR